MANDGQLNVVLCWHMHQPWYRDGLEGEYCLPWVYLHAIKDYSDMAAHLERHPTMKTVVNFAPVLLEQIDEYAQQIEAYLKNNTPMQDSLLNTLAGIEPIPRADEERERLIIECQRCHAPRMIKPYPAFDALLTMTGAAEFAEGKTPLNLSAGYLSEQYFIDLITWYHLAWCGQSLKGHPTIKRLMRQGEQFSLADRRDLLSVMQHCIAHLIPRYRALAEREQVELSMTPYMHPIVPLLQDFSCMHDAMPDAPAPIAENYPGGDERAHWHMEKGLAIFEHYFGHKPKGVWLSEGAISSSAVALLDEYDIGWTASGEGVWGSSSHLSGFHGHDINSKRDLFMPHQHNAINARLFFRDDGLSDMIGFKYSTWDAQDAASDFVQHLKNIAEFLGDKAHKQVVSIILDGENAWEYYPNNGHDFLDSLYSQLSQAEHINMTHFDTARHLEAKPLPRICAGSWVYGSLSTWIGSEDKNRGWDYLVAAKKAYDNALANNTLDAAQKALATRQLAVCEGSDWFWWFGDYNSAGSVSDFESLFRLQLARLYDLLGQDAPVHLSVPLSHGGGGVENAGTMRRNT